ncbi:MAG: IS4 family transposase [Pseudomonadota bacterium]|nr:IS4 family transposase [Pseudomonadota bacterium]
MVHNNTVFAQLMKLVSRHEFESLQKQHHTGRQLRKMTRWSQFIALGFAQLSGRCSLRDIVCNISAQKQKLYHLGVGGVSRSSLARVNEQQPSALYEALFNKLLHRCQGLAPKHGFRFKNKLFSLDASTIEVCLSVFPWANFKQGKGAVKIHVGLDHSGHIPSFMTITDGKVHEVNIGRALNFTKESIVVFDRGYTDYSWYYNLDTKGIIFVTRLKRNVKYKILARRKVSKKQGLSSDQTVRITGAKAGDCPIPLRRIGYRDPETGQQYFFLTNNFKLAASTIAKIYKARWDIELFFKWIKQNLKIKSFVGTSKNAVMTQIWVAMCMYLLLAYIKFSSKLNLSFQQILRLLQLNLFERRDLLLLLIGDPPEPSDTPQQHRLLFA